MKKNILKGLVLFIFLLLLGSFYYYFNRSCFSKDLYKKDFFTNNTILGDSTLKIGLVGDSWVQFGRLDSIIHTKLLNKSIDNLIFASGAGGAVSKEIYENIYKPKNQIFSSKSVIDEHPKYCIVISGINDTNRQMGKKYYSYHLILILETLIKEGIIPIVISIPNYGIMNEYESFSRLKKMRFKTFALINNDGEINNIKEYNSFFRKELAQKTYKDSVIYIDMNHIIKSYDENLALFSDNLHLNISGKEKLGEYIAELIKHKEETR